MGRFVWESGIITTLFSFIIFHALSEETTLQLQPQDVHVNKNQLTWTPTVENAVYRVEYLREDKKEWDKVLGCDQILSSFCNLSSINTPALHQERCVSVRVIAERAGQTSKGVEACSHHGDSCSPEFSLSPGPGSMTVRLTKTSSFYSRHADNGKFTIGFGKEGEELQNTTEAASKIFSNLEEGQRYCAWVQYKNLRGPVGHPRCLQCDTTLVSSTTENTILTCGLIFIILIILVSIVFYILIFKFKKIKQWMEVPYEIPNVFPELQPEQRVFLPPPSEEHYDVITSITPADSRR